MRTQFGKMSKQARAVDLPHEGFGSYFLDVFDRPPRSSACECARSTGASLSQVLHLASSAATWNARSATATGRVAKLIQQKTAPEQAIEELYLAAYSRLPTTAERQFALDYLQRQPDLRRGLEDLVWGIMNSREFMFNH